VCARTEELQDEEILDSLRARVCVCVCVVWWVGGAGELELPLLVEQMRSKQQVAPSRASSRDATTTTD
jgi:hypothetical protein